MAFTGYDRKSAVFSARSGVTSNDVIVAVVLVTFTLMTSRLVDATDNVDIERQWRGYYGGRAMVTWYDDVALYRHNSVLQRDDPTKLEEVYYYYYYYYY